MRARIGLISLPLLVVLVGCPASPTPPPTPPKSVVPAVPATNPPATTKTTQPIEEEAVPDDPAVIAKLEKLGAKVSLDEDKQVMEVDLTSESLDKPEEANEVFDDLAKLTHLRRIVAFGPEIRNDQIGKIAGLKDLVAVELINSNINDGGIEHLLGMTKLDGVEFATPEKDFQVRHEY